MLQITAAYKKAFIAGRTFDITAFGSTDDRLIVGATGDEAVGGFVFTDTSDGAYCGIFTVAIP